MSNTARTATRSVRCPSCKAEAMLIHAQETTHLSPTIRRNIIFLCPNECVPRPPQIDALISPTH